MEWNELAHPQDPGGLSFQNYNRGLGLRLLGKYEDSIAAFRQAGYPDADIPLHIAIALVRLGRIDEAKAEVKVALKNNPKWTGANFRATFFYSDPSIPDARRRRSCEGRLAGEVTRLIISARGVRSQRRRDRTGLPPLLPATAILEGMSAGQANRVFDMRAELCGQHGQIEPARRPRMEGLRQTTLGHRISPGLPPGVLATTRSSNGRRPLGLPERTPD